MPSLYNTHTHTQDKLWKHATNYEIESYNSEEDQQNHIL